MKKSQFVHPEQKSWNEPQIFFENEVANDVKYMKKSINNQDEQNSSNPTPVSIDSTNQNSNGYSKQEETVKTLCIPEIIYDSNSIKEHGNLSPVSKVSLTLSSFLIYPFE